MMDGIRVELSKMLLSDRVALRRPSAFGLPLVVKFGSVAEVMEAYRPGDVVLVGESVWHDMQAQFAQGGTPSQEGR